MLKIVGILKVFEITVIGQKCCDSHSQFAMLYISFILLFNLNVVTKLVKLKIKKLN